VTVTTPQDLHFEKTLKASATFLQRWQGAHAELWQLTSSHKTLQIVLRRLGEDGNKNLLIACVDPIRLRGPIRWDSSDLVIARYPMPQDPADGFVITDAKADLEIICGLVEVKENVKLY
jgi:hypothetical protein